MRIAFINQTYPPMITGVSHMLCNLANGMVTRGHDVLVIVASDTGRPYTITAPGLTIVRLRSVPNPTARGQRCMAWPRREIETILMAFAPDIIHFHDPYLAGIVKSNRHRPYAAPVILTSHLNPEAVDYHSASPSFVNKLLKKGVCAIANRIFHGCDAVVTPSNTSADMIEALSHSSANVISNGINLRRFHPQVRTADEAVSMRMKYGLHPERPVILHVGRLSKEKNIPAVLRAVAEVISTMDAQLLVVGDGPERAPLAAYAEELGLEDRVFFPGFVPPEGDLPALYRLAEVFVGACEIEIQGLVLLEAAASGVPVVAVRAGATPEVVQDGINGWLVPPRDEAAMAARLVEVLQQPQIAASMGLSGRKIAKGHALERTFRAHERLYRRLVAIAPMSHREPVFSPTQGGQA